MKIRIREKENIIILDLEGNIDVNASNFVEMVGGALNNGKKEIVCNFDGVNLVDYVGISIIVVVYKNILNHKGVMKLCNVPAHVKKLFSIVGLDRVFEYYANEEHAITGMKEDKRINKILKKQLRRRFKRISYHGEVLYQQKFSKESYPHAGKIINLSAEGIFVKADKTFSVGDLLSLRINLFSVEEPLEIDAKVVWVTDKEIQPKDFPGMGLDFHDITKEKQEKIIQFVERYLTSFT